MIYLDYSATTPVEKEVLNTFCKVTEQYIANPNSLHKLGIKSRELIDAATNQILRVLELDNHEVIYTSGASEANNMAIKGICFKYESRGKHIITTRLEHSSVTAPIFYLQKKGWTVDFVDIDDKGQVDLESLKQLIKEDTVLVSICSVNSEVGIVQPIEEIAAILKQYPKLYFHSDMTQSIGKLKIKLEDIDLISFSAQKIYGIKGIGCLLKKKKISMEPLIHGGKSTTIYRSGTPAVGLIASISKALRLISENQEEKYQYVQKLNSYLKEKFKNNHEIHLNSNEYSSAYIINISVMGIKPETLLHALEKEDIYISTQTACSEESSKSIAVYEVTKNDIYAMHSIRISLSTLTTKEELDQFYQVLEKSIKELRLLNESH